MVVNLDIRRWHIIYNIRQIIIIKPGYKALPHGEKLWQPFLRVLLHTSRAAAEKLNFSCEIHTCRVFYYVFQILLIFCLIWQNLLVQSSRLFFCHHQSLSESFAVVVGWNKNWKVGARNHSYIAESSLRKELLTELTFIYLKIPESPRLSRVSEKSVRP